MTEAEHTALIALRVSRDHGHGCILNDAEVRAMLAEIERLRAERDALRELLLFAGQELVCGCAGIDGDDPQDVGEGWQESHWCPRCDDSVDRNWELRTRIRAALAQTGANDVER